MMEEAKPFGPNPNQILSLGARASFERGGGGLGPKSLCTKKWPNQICPIAHFVFSHDGHFGLEGVWGRGPPPPRVFNYSQDALLGAHGDASRSRTVGKGDNNQKCQNKAAEAETLLCARLPLAKTRVEVLGMKGCTMAVLGSTPCAPHALTIPSFTSPYASPSICPAASQTRAHQSRAYLGFGTLIGSAHLSAQHTYRLGTLIGSAHLSAQHTYRLGTLISSVYCWPADRPAKSTPSR